MLQNETARRRGPLADQPERRWQNMLAAGDPRAVERQCTAKSKQTGERCRNAARKGYRVCGYHGVRRFDRITPKIAERRARAAAIGGAQVAVEAALDHHLLLPETLAIFRKEFAYRVPLRLHAAFLFALEARLLGRMSTAMWRKTLHRFLRQNRPPFTTSRCREVKIALTPMRPRSSLRTFRSFTRCVDPPHRRSSMGKGGRRAGLRRVQREGPHWQRLHRRGLRLFPREV
jgi:hypothetical protein